MYLRWIVLAFLSGWFGVALAANELILTDAQRQWLSEHPHLRIGFTSIPPQVFHNPNTGELTGLCIDYLDAVEDQLGYRFEQRHFNSWKAMMDAIEANEIDIVYAAQRTPLREAKYVFSLPYLTFQNIILTPRNVEGPLTIESLRGKKVAVVRGNSIEEELNRLHPDFTLTPVEDELTGLLKLSFYEVDAMIIEPSRASWIIDEKKITNLHVAGTTDMVFNLGYMVRKDISNLTDILNAAITAIPANTTTRAIFAKWIQPPQSYDWTWLWWLIAGIVVVILVLHGRIVVRTRQLINEQSRRQLAEQLQSTAEEQFRHIIELCPLGIHTWRLEPDGRLILTGANTAAEKILKLDHRPLIGQTIVNAFPGLADSKIPNAYKKVCIDGIPFSDTQYTYRDNQTAGVFELFAFQTAPRQMATMFSEISERIASQEALRQSEARLDSIFRAAPAAIGVIVDRIFQQVNDQMCNMLGYSREELLGQSSCMIYPTQEEFDHVGSEKYAQIRLTGVGTIQSQWKTKSGEIRDVMLSSAAFDMSDLSKGSAFVAIDITDYVRVQRRLKESEEQYRQTIEFAVDGILQGSPDGIITGANSQMQKLAGRPLDKLLGLHVSDLFDPKELQRTPLAFDSVNAGQTVTKERTLLRPDGTGILVEMHSKKMPNGTYQSIYRDITERKQTEEALAKSERRLSNAISATTDALWEWNLKTHETYNSPRWYEMLGYSDNQFEMTDESWKRLCHPDDYDMAMQQLQKCLQKQKMYSAEFRMKRADGSWMWILGRGKIVEYDTDGKPMLLSGTNTDITERKQAEELIQRNTERLEVLLKLNQMTDAPLKTISDFALEEAVRMTQSSVGYFAFVNDEQTVLTMYSWSRNAMAQCAIENKPLEFLVEKAGVWAEPVRQRKAIICNNDTDFSSCKKGVPQGHVPLTRHLHVPIFSGSKIVMVAGVGNKNEDYDQTDVQQLTLLMDGLWHLAERIRTEQMRDKLMKEIQSKNNELESIVFVASHDLRSPLINIQGFAGELGKSCHDLTVLLGRETLGTRRDIRHILDEDIPESLGFISAGTAKMDSLVKGLLQIARIGTTPLHIDKLDMNRLMVNILKTLQYQIREYEIDLRIGELPPCLGDWTQLNQVFSNLIDNAIKYRHLNRKAVIEIAGRSENKRVIYFIRDNGIGIEPQHCEKIFEIFHRLSPSGPVKGEGLGLTIVRRTLDRMDGKITVESEADQGATFIVTLPAAEYPAQ
jgi:PAS domain S-box-containing protein